MRKLTLSVLLIAMGASNAMAQEMTWSPTATRFSLWSPSADSVKVNIYTDGQGGTPLRSLTLHKENICDKWVALLPGDNKGKFYTFQIIRNIQISLVI